MKKLATLVACSAFIYLHAQTTLYTENFEGASPTFTLNTSDMSGTTFGYNHWVINNSFTGGTYNDNICTFSPVPISGTPTQPGAITNSPTSKYLHIVDVDAEGQGISNANFAASDGGLFCLNDEINFAKMASDISTVGYTNVTLTFYWLCTGSANNYGEVYYSTDGGTSWNLQQTAMQGQGSWTMATITNASFDNQATLRFGFRFVNNMTFSASDPPFSIDEIKITVPAAASVTTGNITAGSPYCAGENLIVPYTITGSFTGGNTFTAQLSDALGSFASPVAIGNVISTSAGNINCMIPIGTASGTAYAIRVVSSSPITTGSSSGPLTIDALPNATSGNTGPYCAGATIMLTSPAGGTLYSWSGPAGFSSSSQNPSIPSSTLAMNGAYTVTVSSVNGCTNTSSTTVSVVDCSGIEDESIANTIVYPNPSADVFTISVPDGMVNESNISIINLVGETVYTFTPSQTKTMISSESLGLRSGIYLIQMKWHDQSKVIRLVVR